ncbi:TVP38/TMEM64 family protein [Bacillus canaveralius]|uniref:TVP38/TMEM64 family membrane protein n=1 Tax=Bacillus canaveralius TaxID=1403243 RepID=A0A2N5GQ33_9BACI|nr:VTT domain-containing protein [Bacillus canaveralius]PLR84929.1 TVP38/TMEM64 family protein [Bacillus canaveralius]PLR95831.1 TVP38/TMEM64 family protein [Bacillus canaveralius]RSK52377.1 TVP38/TMEM64 family protein [Bacillus canaveralius]
MDDFLLEWFPVNPIVAALISIAFNIAIAISGVVPSAFITAGNIAFFGFETGLIVSIAGEAAGAIVSFVIYRKGINKFTTDRKMKNTFLRKLKNTGGVEAAILVLLLRILPFVPSGAVTLAAGLSKMGLISFSIASTVGKAPSLLIEAYSVNTVFNLKMEWQLGILIFVIVVLFAYFVRKRRKIKQEIAEE